MRAHTQRYQGWMRRAACRWTWRPGVLRGNTLSAGAAATAPLQPDARAHQATSTPAIYPHTDSSVPPTYERVTKYNTQRHECPTRCRLTWLFALGAEAGACCRLVAVLAALAAGPALRGDVAIAAANVALERWAGGRLVACARQGSSSSSSAGSKADGIMHRPSMGNELMKHIAWRTTVNTMHVRSAAASPLRISGMHDQNYNAKLLQQQLGSSSSSPHRLHSWHLYSGHSPPGCECGWGRPHLKQARTHWKPSACPYASQLAQ
jgi:hypothetical protein